MDIQINNHLIKNTLINFKEAMNVITKETSKKLQLQGLNRKTISVVEMADRSTSETGGNVVGFFSKNRITIIP